MGEANKIVVANIHIESATKEAVWALPKGTKWFTLQCRAALDVLIAFETGHVVSAEPPYFTLKTAQAWSERVDIKEPLTIFFGATSSTDIEAIIGIAEEDM